MEDQKIPTREIVTTNILRNRIMKYAEDHKTTIEDARMRLANHMNVTRNQLTYWENNTVQPAVGQCILIAQFFGLKVESIFIIKEI